MPPSRSTDDADTVILKRISAGLELFASKTLTSKGRNRVKYWNTFDVSAKKSNCKALFDAGANISALGKDDKVSS